MSRQQPRSLDLQVHEKLKSMLDAGQGRSKHADKRNSTSEGRIYSFTTYRTYKQQCIHFVRWLQAKHPEIKTLKKARPFVREWLEALQSSKQEYSTFTLQTAAKAVGKLYGIQPTDKDYWKPPIRHRTEITRSRGATKTDSHFSVTNNDLFIRFCKATGLRREGVGRLKPEDVYSAEKLPQVVEQIKAKPPSERTPKEAAMLANFDKIKAFNGRPQYYIFTREKGGKWRFAPIIGSPRDVRDVLDKVRSTPPGKAVWEHVPKNADIHSYRADYAIMLYKLYARPIDQIPYDKYHAGIKRKIQSDVYICRGDQKGMKLDKRAMEVVEKALGHEKPHTFASHYAYKL